MAFGLGGLGGRAMSFPTRPNYAPDSQVVDFIPNQEAWTADWQARYDAEKAKARAPSTITNTGVAGNLRPAPVNPVPYGDGSAFFSDLRSVTPPSSGRPNIMPPGSAPAPVGPSAFDPQRYFSDLTSLQPPGGSRPTVYNDYIDPGYTPDFTALNAEKASMMPVFENQNRQQQGYDSMRGWGQENAVMGPDYTNPNFGQISGDPINGQGASPLSGVGQGAMNGVYNPEGSYAGVFGNFRRSNWGL